MTLRFACVIPALMMLGCFQPGDDGGDEIADTTETADDTTTDDTTTATTTTDDTTEDTTEDTTGTDTDEDSFVFAEDPPEAYVRIDRMGMPAVATAVITSKDDYNAANPTDDANAMFVSEMVANVNGLHMAIDDDLVSLGLVPCPTTDCLAQAGPLVVPDTLKLDLVSPAGFPNGRRLEDPVIDITLAVILLDLSVMGQHPAIFADVPVNPPANDVPFLPAFPYLADPH